MAMEKNRPTLLAALKYLLHVSFFFGLIPHSAWDYYKLTVLKVSIFGNIYCLVNAVSNAIQYHFASIAFVYGDKQDPGTLTRIIGLVIMYMEPLMLSIDVTGFLIHQKNIIKCFDSMQKIDEKLAKENIEINHSAVRRLTIILILIATFLEFGLLGYNFVLFQELTMKSLWWAVTCLPIYLSTVSKIWFVSMVFSVKQKFEAINDHFEETVTFFEASKVRKLNGQSEKSNHFNEKSEEVLHKTFMPDNSVDLAGYLHKEVFPLALKRKNKIFQQNLSISGKLNNNIVQVLPAKTIDETDFYHGDRYQPNEMVSINGKRLDIDDKMDKKLTRLCQLHDEICEIGKDINQMFSFQMLILMAYGFMSLTAQFYFVYCGLVGQSIPILFRSAESLIFSIVYIVYTGAKCVYVIFISWQTKLSAQKTGVQIHKIANVIDEDHCYQIVNHLSLKLLNHQLNFTACGFFELDMTTLYAITGAITSYLIILIQFNLAGQRNKKTNALNTTDDTSSTMAATTEITDLINTIMSEDI